MAAEDREARPVMHVAVRNASLMQAMALLPVLPDHVAMEVVCGAEQHDFLFVRGVFYGPPSALSKLRRLLAADASGDVTLHAHTGLAGLWGKPITALELVLDPTGALGTE